MKQFKIKIKSLNALIVPTSMLFVPIYQNKIIFLKTKNSDGRNETPIMKGVTHTHKTIFINSN